MNKKYKKSKVRGSRRGVSPAEFSRMLGVPRSTVSRALSAGLIVAEPGGLIDPRRRINADYAHDTAVRLAERRALRYARPDGSRTLRTLSEAQRREAFATMPALDIEAELKRMPVPASLKQMKLFAEIQKIAVDIKARLAELIARPLVEDRLQELGQNIDMLEALTGLVSARICAKLGRPDHIEKVKAIIALEVKKIIQDFKMIAAKKI